MRLLADDWRDSFLDYARLPNQCRIAVHLWMTLKAIEDVYVKPRRHWRVLLNYAREVGIRKVIQKVASRRRERLRNDKYLAIGWGRILERPEQSEFQLSQSVIFLAPCHPKCVDRITLSEGLLRPLEPRGALGRLQLQVLFFFEGVEFNTDLAEKAQKYAGWSEFSGVTLDTAELSRLLGAAAKELEDLDLTRATQLPLDSEPIRENMNRALPGKGVTPAALIGYGQYAKTVILPNLASGIRIGKVHEIDPCQLGDYREFRHCCDTSPTLRDSERFDVYFVAGYHHTHAPTASDALRRGAAVVVEKPLATTPGQLDELMIAIRASARSQFFAGFQKRYSCLTRWAIEDLGARPGSPISYRCIVYEIEVPKRHWYNWPNSGSRILSNGCHWIDHFLYLNEFSAVRSFDVREVGSSGLLVVIELDNDACFTMTLGDQGSPRIGMQEYIELTSGKRTARIRNFSEYCAEDELRVLRKAKVNKLESFREMYREISHRILSGFPGDSPLSVVSTAGLTLHIEEKLQAARRETMKGCR